MLEHRAPQLTLEDAVGLAEEHYGLAASARGLPSYLDQNFLLEAGGVRYVLKISNAAADNAVVGLQQDALLFLAERPQRDMFPRLFLTQEGARSVMGESGHLLWMVTYVPGRPLAEVRPQTSQLLHGLGHFLGALDHELEEFSHPQAKRDFSWDLRRATALRKYIPHLGGAARRALVEQGLDSFEKDTLPLLKKLRASVIHNDANDYNVLVSGKGYDAAVSGLIDFGDMLHAPSVFEVAIAATYVMLDKRDPLGAASALIRGYHEARPLQSLEIEALPGLIKARLCGSVLASAFRSALDPENEYARVSESPAWALLEMLTEESPRLATYRFREACGLEVCPPAARAAAWLKRHADAFAPVIKPDVRMAPPLVFDLSVGSSLAGYPGEKVDPNRVAEAWVRRIKRAGAHVGVGRYNEARIVYSAEQFRSPNDEYDEYRTIHLGLDLFQEAGSGVFAPLDGVVHSAMYSERPLDYGGVLLLRHEADNCAFFTLYGHLRWASISGLSAGDPVLKGQQIGELGDPKENGGWAPHLHFQVIGDLLHHEGSFPGVAPASQRALWLGICPDPNVILGIPETCFPAPGWTSAQILERRGRHIGGNLSVSYRQPLHIVRGYRQFLYNAEGRAFLDAVNNVAHVGHCHPRILRAAQRQMAVLNTNTRYLQDTLVRYAERLSALMPDPLSVCFFVNSGSEANDLALRLAFAHTNRRDVVVLEGAYHGHLSALIEISPYKFDGPGGRGRPPHAHTVTRPDPYRGPHRGPGSGARYADEVLSAIVTMEQRGRGLAAFVSESLLGCGGQIEFPEGYLRGAYRHTRAAGGVCIADEVQVGFGRLGSHFWGFETQDVEPDIVVLGKPIGNGHPLAAVVTTKAIAASFNNGMEFFSTFGGNGVSCAVGMAVLDVIEEEGLQANAAQTGAYLKDALIALRRRRPIVGDVRGLGLFLGVELVLDRETLEPATPHAAYVANRLSERGVLVSTDGPHQNVLKIKPPMIFNQANADALTSALDAVLQEDFARL